MLLQKDPQRVFMSPVSSVFHTVETVKIDLKLNKSKFTHTRE